MGGLNVSKNQKRLLQILKENNRWFTAFELADLLNMSPRRVYVWMQSKTFSMMECDLIPHDDPVHKEIKAWRFPNFTGDNAKVALKLSKMFSGWYGQLYWATDKEILHSLSKN
jgi:hypothetical protein